MKKFDIPFKFKSDFIRSIKEKRKAQDPRKKDFSPSAVKFKSIEILFARHFGFCYGVENAIEISYKALRENPNRNIFLLSQMIHNPHVNKDLEDNGIRFIQDTYSNQLISWDQIKQEDIVIIPAFGTTRAIQNKLEHLGVDIKTYNTTCPFVEKVWKTSKKLGEKDFTVIIHGKPKHEETRATFSHSSAYAKSVVIKDIQEAKIIGDFILGKIDETSFYDVFKNRISDGFDLKTDLFRVGVVNQTTMLASETTQISTYFKDIMLKKYGEDHIKAHFADTRDTLCYATNDNQKSTFELLKQEADLAIVVGGFNSSNTTHLAELCAQKFNTYFISSADDILDENTIRHFDIHSGQILEHSSYWPKSKQPRVILTSGASCPDSIMQEITEKLVALHDSL